ncbi:MAG TPA: GNAT family N-acetyltransferase, partial [Acidimicrobiia bacterium]
MEHDLIAIRPFGEEDIGPAVAIEAASQPRPWTEGVFADELMAQDRVYLAAEAGGLVGFGGVMVIGDEAHVTNLLVSVERRGQGIGRRL